MGKIRAWGVWFWTQHVQKTFGTLLLGSGLYDEAADLYTQVVTYAPELSDLIGHAAVRRIRLTCVAIIVTRAIIRPRPPPSS